MKRVIGLFIALFAVSAIFSTSTVYGQCGDDANGSRKKGIAIVRSEDGRPENPKGAMTFPRYVGGSKEMCKYLCKNMQYPAQLKDQKVNGITTVGFTVKSDGTVTNASVVTSSGYQEFDDEAVRLVNSFPAWKPATKDCEATEMNSQVDVEFNVEKCVKK